MSCCIVASRPDAAEIDQALRDGVPYRAVAGAASLRGTDISASAIYRHRGHLTGLSVLPSAPPSEPEAELEAPKNHAEAVIPTVLWPITRQDENEVSGEALRLLMLEEQAVKLRLKNVSFREIGKLLGVSHRAAYDAVERVYERTRKGASEMIDRCRFIDVQRIEEQIASVWDRSVNSSLALEEEFDDNGASLGWSYCPAQDKAQERVQKLLERRAKLLGLDAPTGPTTQINILNQMAQTAEFREILEAILSGLEQYPGARETAMERVRGVLARRGK